MSHKDVAPTAIVLDTVSGKTWGYGDPAKVQTAFDTLIKADAVPRQSLACLIGRFTAEELKKLKDSAEYALSYYRQIASFGRTV